ncbi:MAG: type II toxin-antitoxin system RelE/ParE family toxin [Candidatus Micrarchaeota archaeon]
MREIQVASKAVKFLRGLPEDYKNAIKERLKELETNLLPRGAIQLKGQEKCYRLRVGPFRIQYHHMEKEDVVLIYKISRRDETMYE